MILPKYSICITNMNMEATIETALTSVLDQLDDTYEMVVVDESTDSSRQVLLKMQSKYQNLKTVFLEPNRKRTIADARNISIQESTGEYCLLHIDCDDIWEPFIPEFVKVFHRLEALIPQEILLVGQQLNMGRRDFLLSHGPYRNGATGEDRDMWMRLAKAGAFFPMNHVPFFHRMPLPKKTQKMKALVRNYYSIRDGIRSDLSLRSFLSALIRNPGKLTYTTRSYNLVAYPLAFLNAKLLGSIDTSDYFENIDDWNSYKVEHGGTFLEIARRYNPTESINFLSDEGKWLFSNKRYEKQFSDMEKELRLSAQPNGQKIKLNFEGTIEI